MTRAPLPSADELLRHAPWLERLAASLARDADEASQLVGECYALALERGPRDRSALGAWLRTVLKRLAARERRSTERRRERERRAARSERTVATDELVARVEMQRGLLAELLGLPERQREVLLLHFWEGCSVPQIAERLGCPIDTVRTRKKRALATLRRTLDREHGRESWLLVLAPFAKTQAPAACSGSATLACIGAFLMSSKSKTLFVAALCVSLAMLGYWQLRDDTLPVATDSESSHAVLADEVRDLEDTIPTPEEAELGGVRERQEPADPAQDPVPGSITLRFRVIEEGSDSGLAGAELRLSYVLERDGAVRARSDADGRVEVEFPAALRAERGALPTNAWVFAEGFAPRHFIGVTPASPGADTRELDLGELAMRRGSRIAGQVRDAATGEALAGAEILLHPFLLLGTRFAPAECFAMTRSDERGFFELPERVCAQRAFAPTLFAVHERGIAWTRIRALPEGGQRDDLVLSLHRGPALALQVTDPAGRAVEGVHVELRPLHVPFCRRFAKHAAIRHELPSPFAERLQGHTDTAGRLQFASLPVRGEGRETNEHARVVLCCSRAGFVEHSEIVTVAQDAPARASITLHPVQPRRIRGSIKDEAGRAIHGATIRTRGAEVARSGQDGSFEVERILSTRSQFVLNVAADGFLRRFVTVDFAPAEQLQEVDVVLQRCTPIAGRVIDQRSRGVPDLRVLIVAGAGNASRGRALGTTTAADGSFRFEEACSGAWSLLVQPGQSGLRIDAPSRFLVSGGDEELVLPIYRVAPGRGTLRCEIQDLATGRALLPARARLYLLARGGLRTRLSENTHLEEGLVTASGLPAGRWRLVVSTEDGREGETEFELARGQAIARTRISLRPARHLLVRLDEASLPPGSEELTWNVRSSQGSFAAELSQVPWAQLNPRAGYERVLGGLDPEEPLQLRLEAEGFAARYSWQRAKDAPERLTLKPRDAYPIRIEGGASLQVGYYQVWLAERGGELELVRRGTHGGGALTVRPLSRPPGRYRYELVYLSWRDEVAGRAPSRHEGVLELGPRACTIRWPD